MESLDTNLAVLFQWLLRATLQGSLLVCLILAIKLLLRERLPARWHYCLWLILLVRLSLPWAPQSRLSIYSLIPRSSPFRHAVRVPDDTARSDAVGARPGALGQQGGTEPALTSAQDEALQQGQGETVVSTPSVAAARQIGGAPPAGRRSFAEFAADVVPWLWLGGCLALGGYIFVRAFSLWRAVTSERPLTDQGILDLLEDCKMQMRIRTIVGVVVTDEVRTPALFGFVRPRILLPQGLIEAFALDDLHHVFLHELAHLKRRDIYLAWLVCLVQVVHWFNPLMWYAFRRMRADQEMAADALALSGAGMDESHRYARTIVRLLERFSRPQYLPSLAGILENPSHIEKRIQMIARLSPTRRRPLLAAVLLAVLGLIALTDAQNKPESDEPAPVRLQATDAPALKDAFVAGEHDTVVDPNAGLTFVPVAAIAGANDPIDSESWAALSPNGRLLLDVWEGRVVPLDGSPAFTLKELQGRDVARWSTAWSPDGRKLAYFAEGIEILPVSPDTGRPTGPARRLLEEKGGWYRGRLYWSADSERILFVKRKSREYEGGSITLRDGRVNRHADYADFGLVSPDGRTIAYSMPDGIWTRAVGDGTARIVRTRAGGWTEDVQLWTSDNQWIVSVLDGWGWKNVHFTRPSDGQKLDLFPPQAAGTFVGKSTDGRKLYFYRSSFDDAPLMFKVVPVSGGPVTSLRASGSSQELWEYSWTPDSTSLATLSFGTSGKRQDLWLIPVDGKERIQFNMDSLGHEEPWLWRVSPDSRKLLYGVRRGTDEQVESVDLYVAPISVAEGRATGPAVPVFEGLKERHPEVPMQMLAWSLDATKIALPLWDGTRIALWILSADGGKPIQIDEDAGWPSAWSPDSKRIAFSQAASDRWMLRVIPAEGGTARTILTTPKDQSAAFDWSPDSQEMVVACEGTITSLPVAGGTGRVLLRLQDAGYESVSWLRWSPDGRHLAFDAWKRREPSRMCLFSPEAGRITTLDNCPTGRRDLTWSPDSKMLCCSVWEPVKTRPAGVIRELDVAAALQKAPPVAEEKPAEIKPAAETELITGPIFSDNFDGGLSKHWSIVDSKTETSPPPGHAVENGQLMLSNSTVRLYQIDWADYVVTVRVCLKEAAASGESVFGIQARTTPSSFGIKNMDRYNLVITCLDGAPTGLYLGINYRDASNTGHNVSLGRSPCEIVPDQWYTLEFEVRGRQLRGYLDGKLMVEGTDERLSRGGIWLGAWRTRGLVDDFSIRQLP